MRQKVDENELFKELNEMCLKCANDCKQPKAVKIYKCKYQPKETK